MYRTTRKPEPKPVPDQRECIDCHETKYIEEFPHQVTPAGYVSWSTRCRDCRNALRRTTWAARTPEQRRAAGHKANGRPLTPAQFAALEAAQESRCAICREQPPPRQLGRPRADGTRAMSPGLVYDHSHETGNGRGLLCHRCNAMLGHARDSAEILQAAIAYLATWDQRHRETG